MSVGSRSLRSAVAGLLLTGAQAQGANPEFQSFFFAVCSSPSGALAVRCAETPGGLGNLSGDSESSLNPSQSLGHTQPALGSAVGRGKSTRERSEHLRSSEATGEIDAHTQDKALSALIDVRVSDFGRDSTGLADPERGFNGDTRAVEIGFDYAASPRVVLGALLGIERLDNEFDAENPAVNFQPAQRAGASEADSRYATLFGSFAFGRIGFLELAAGYEQSDGRYQRFSVFQESTRAIAQTNVVTEARADGSTRWLSFNAGFDVSRGAFSFGSFAGLTRTRSQLDGYTEQDLTGSGLAMTFGEVKQDSLLAHAGVRASYAISSVVGVLVPQLRIEHHAELEEDVQRLSARFVLDPQSRTHELTGDRADASTTHAGLSLSMILPNGWMPFLDYDLLLDGSGRDRQHATLGLRVEF